MPPKSDGKQLRRLRILRGLTATEFARRAGYSLNHVSQVELGNSNAGPAFLRTAARILGCKVSDLMTEEPKRKVESAPAAPSESGSAA